MITQAFEHAGLTFTVRPRTGFHDMLSDALRIDIGTLILSARGFDIDGKYPRTLDILIIQFIQWMQVTTIEGDSVLKDINLMGLSDTIEAAFTAWEILVTADNGACWQLWSDAYDKANPIAPDPEESGDDQTSTETTTT